MTDTITRARALAHRLHAGQVRRGAAREPYVTHLAEVAALVTEWGGDTTAVAAAWLHDTIEDCPPFLAADLATEMGATITAIVLELTDDKALPKAERKRLQVVNAPGKSPRAALIKLADKTSNVGALVTSPPEGWSRARRSAYVDWGVEVVQALPTPLPRAGLDEFYRRVARARPS